MKNFLLAITLVPCLAQSLSSASRVSIITSVFKGDQFVNGFMEDIVRQSIFEQKNADGSYVCQLILINANSPDAEESVIMPYLEKHPNIVYKKLESDPGLYGVWNIAIELADGDLITNANLDDRLAPRSLELHKAYLDNHLEIDIVYSNNYWTPTKNEPFEIREKLQPALILQLDNRGILWNTEHDFCAHQLRSGLVCGHHPMWRKSIHTRFGYFNTHYKSAGDWEMWCRAYVGGSKFFKIPEFLGSYYLNPDGLSTAQSKKESVQNEIHAIYNLYADKIN